MHALIGQLPSSERENARAEAERLLGSGVRALMCDAPRFPAGLRSFAGSPPALFYRGLLDCLDQYSIGLSGSRNASEEGLRAARACGEEVASLSGVLVSGYAKGVDTEGHLSALSAGAGTVAVLAEGIDQFKLRAEYRSVGEAIDRGFLVVSQFPPSQRWTAGAAMARNQVVIGLSRALVVVEARGSGGTVKAGQAALRGGRPVFVLAGAGSVHDGNEQLLAAGAQPVADRAALAESLHRVRSDEAPQLPLL